MIDIVFVRDESEQIVGYDVCGHADYSVICSAVSAVTQTIWQGLEYYNLASLRKCEPGHFAVSDIKINKKRAATLIATLMLSLKDLAEQYPESIRITDL